MFGLVLIVCLFLGMSISVRVTSKWTFSRPNDQQLLKREHGEVPVGMPSNGIKVRERERETGLVLLKVASGDRWAFRERSWGLSAVS